KTGQQLRLARRQPHEDRAVAGDVDRADVVKFAVQLEATAQLVHGHVRTRLDEAAQLRRRWRRLICRLGRLWLLFRLVGRLGFIHVFGSRGAARVWAPDEPILAPRSRAPRTAA